MDSKVDNAIILAAGFSKRFAPVSLVTPKGLIEVKGEVLIERQIRQLQEVGIHNIIVVVGYKKEKFMYLQEKCKVLIVENTEYETRNNHSSIYAARHYLKNSYICAADNYFSTNPFEIKVQSSYYMALFSKGKTSEWCLQLDEADRITRVTIGGENCWYMLGNAFWTESFSQQFLKILEAVYEKKETQSKLWEEIYAEHMDMLTLKIRRCREGQIHEFDTLDDLKKFDLASYHKCLAEYAKV